MNLRDGKGKTVVLDRELGRGGEGAVYTVSRNERLVAKIYHAPSAEKSAKLQAMVSRPPVDPASRKGHVSICWPQTLLYDQSGATVGFLMPSMDRKRHLELFRLYNPQARRTEAPDFTWAYLLKIAENIASVVESLHARGYVIGDMNESNFFVSNQALVTLVDCDSMQVPNGAKFFRCPVSKPEYMPPELQSINFADVDRTAAHDNFALSVLVFLLLMEGVHPYAGVWASSGDPPPLEERIRRGECAYAGSSTVKPMPSAVPYDILPSTLKSLFMRAFGYGHKNPADRPSAREWREALSAVGRNLSKCRTNAKHEYPSHLPRCPWCERAQLLGGLAFDPFPSVLPLRQQPLAPKPFAAPLPPRPLPSPVHAPPKPPLYSPPANKNVNAVVQESLAHIFWLLRKPLFGGPKRYSPHTSGHLALRLYIMPFLALIPVALCLRLATAIPLNLLDTLAYLLAGYFALRLLVALADTFRAVIWISRILTLFFFYNVGLILIEGPRPDLLRQAGSAWLFCLIATWLIEQIAFSLKFRRRRLFRP